MTSSFASDSRSRAAIALAVFFAFVATFAFSSANAAAAVDCANPYYYTAPECLPPGSTTPPPSAVEFGVSNRCRSRNFVLRPKYSGAPVVSSKLYRNGRKYIFDTTAPFTFRIQVRKLKKGKSYRFRLVTNFTSGEVVVKNFRVKRCGKPAKRR